METDSFRILTQRQPGTCHIETNVEIDWRGMTEQDFRIMSRCLIVHILQARFKAMKGSIPENIRVTAKEMVHMEVFVPKEYQPRRKKDAIDKLLERLSEEEMQQLSALLLGETS